MEGIAIIFETADGSLERPAEEFSREYNASLSCPSFFPVLANLAQFCRGEELKVDHPAPVKRMHCLLRSRKCDLAKSKELKHALKRNGYDLVVFSGYSHSCRLDKKSDGVKALVPEKVQPYHRYLDRRKKHAWYPDTLTPPEILPAIIKLSSGGILRNPDGSPRVFRENVGKYEADEIIAESLGPEIDQYTGTIRRAPLWFEQYVDTASEGGIPVEWRAYYYLGRLFHLCPKCRIPEGGITAPPREMVEASPDWSMFCSIDYALDTRGRWWILSKREGQFSPLPAGGDPIAFLQGLAEEIEHGYDYPAWAWCVTGTIVQSHRIGERKVEVKGSRHFAAGQKVYVIDGYFGLGAQRCTVVGRPKCSDRYVCVDMDTDLIENFAVEKVADDTILRAIYTGRLYEKFERDSARIWSCWGNVDEDYEKAKRFADYSNKYYRKTMEERPTYRSDKR